jgi:hypothetical protein
MFKDMAGPSWGNHEESDMKVQVAQEPEITKEPQIGFGYKTGDGTKKEFPNPREKGEEPPF